MRIALAAFIALVLLPAYALADGVFFSHTVLERVGVSGQMVTSPRQEAVLIRDVTTTRVILRTHFNAGPKELAWVIPVPAAPTDIGPADDKLFTVLEISTAPRFIEPGSGSGGMPFGCGCGAMASDRGLLHVGGITVEGQGTAGIYEWTALGAADAAKLQTWLDVNGYLLPPGAVPVLDRYVKQGWHWLAVKVRAEETDKPTLAPHPITYRYRSAELVYPLAISQALGGQGERSRPLRPCRRPVQRQQLAHLGRDRPLAPGPRPGLAQRHELRETLPRGNRPHGRAPLRHGVRGIPKNECHFGGLAKRSGTDRGSPVLPHPPARRHDAAGDGPRRGTSVTGFPGLHQQRALPPVRPQHLGGRAVGVAGGGGLRNRLLTDAAFRPPAVAAIRQPGGAAGGYGGDQRGVAAGAAEKRAAPARRLNAIRWVR